MDPIILHLGTRWKGMVSFTTGGVTPGEGAILRPAVYSARSRTPDYPRCVPIMLAHIQHIIKLWHTYSVDHGAGCSLIRQLHSYMMNFRKNRYSKTPLIRINRDGKPSGYAENPDSLDFSLKIGYIGSLIFGCYYLQYVPLPKPVDHTGFEVLEAITLYCTLSDNR